MGYTNKRLVLITACGRGKEEKPTIAGKLYKSSRIRHLYRKSRELGIPFYILSAKYGLVYSDTVIEPYNEVLTKEKCKALEKQIKDTIKNFDIVIFYKGGTKKSYYRCIESICDSLDKRLFPFGFGNMGDIGKLIEILQEIKCEA